MTLGVPQDTPRRLPPELDLITGSRLVIRVLSLALLGALAVSAFALVGWWRADARFANEQRLTYVKLSPDGTWSIQQDFGEQASYYDATLRTVLYDWVERRYSMRSATIVDDWGIVNAMYSPALRAWFRDEFGVTEKATEHAKCASCVQTELRVRTHQHIDPLPTAIGDTETAPVRTLIYATEKTFSANSRRALSETRKLFRVTWRLLAKHQIQANPQLLRYNPLGVEVIAVEVTDDPS